MITKFTDLTTLHFEIWDAGDGVFVGRCLDLDVYSQGGSIAEAEVATKSAVALTLRNTARLVSERATNFVGGK